MSAPAASLASRLAGVRRRLQRASVDALLVTHLPNVLYLTGLRATAGAVLVTRRQAILVVDPRYVAAARELVRSASGRGRLRLEEASRAVDETLADLIVGLGLRRVGIESPHLPVARFEALRRTVARRARDEARRRRGPRPGVPRLQPTDGLVEAGRLVKDRREIATFREAARRLSDVARVVPTFLRPGRTEREVAADIDYAVRRAGFERSAFETIVASGPNSVHPHARPTDRRLHRGDAVVLDFGGVYDGYCVDLSRTACLGRPAGALERIHAAVVDAQEAAIRIVRPGVPASAVDAAARRVLERAGLGAAFVHGTGHGLGLEVHEAPRLGRAQPGGPDPLLRAGMVMTVEPGAYVPGIGGVRVEDDVLVVARGREVLTDAPRTLWVIA